MLRKTVLYARDPLMRRSDVLGKPPGRPAAGQFHVGLLVAGLLVAGLLVPGLAGAQETVEFSGRSWTVRGDWTLGEHLGREALLARNAILALDDTTFANGTIEFDVAVAGHRSFVGVAFRTQEDGSYEDFYLRPHQSGRFDALQYTPVWHDASAWQLYPEYNAEALIPRGEWLHVRLEVTNGDLEAYLGDAAEPVMVIERMRGPDAPGGLALKAFFPGAGDAPGFFPNAFSNVRVTAGGAWRRRGSETVATDPGLITRWAISQSFPGVGEPVEAYPDDLVSQATWQTASTDSIGRVNLAELEGIAEDQRMGLKLARVVVPSETARDLLLDFGASDRVSIFLNGRLLFSGNNTYRSRSQRYLGVMTLDNDTVSLTLETGDNELLFAVTEAFGGWGVTARLRDPGGAEPPASRP